MIPRLFMTLVGCSLPGRHTEQHDVFFGIASSIRKLVPAIRAFWPEAADKGKLHLDAWREVRKVDGFSVQVADKRAAPGLFHLFFINLGGYRRNEFEEFHYKLLVAAAGKTEAIRKAKQTAFFHHTGFKGAPSHIDDQYGVDVDDLYAVRDILPATDRQQYSLLVQPAPPDMPEDELHLGYFRLDAVDKWGS